MNMTPIAADDAFTVQQGALNTTITGNLGVNNGSGPDADPDGTVLGWAGVGFDPVANETQGYLGAFFSNGVLGFLSLQNSGYVTFPVFSTVTILTTAAGGRVVLHTNGDFTYTAPAGFSGVDYVDYALVDGAFATDIARATFNVTANSNANAQPVAADDVFSGIEDTQITGNVLLDNGNGVDFDPNKDALTVTNQTIFTIHGGKVSISANGDFVYIPAANYNGPDSFIYTVTDIHGAKDTATVTLNIAAVDDAPIARDDAFSGVHSKPISGNVLLNDTDADKDPLTAVAAIINTAAGGVVTLLADGNFTYVPAANFVGVDGFVYTVEDSQGNSATATVSLNVLNAAPMTGTDWYSAAYGQSIVGNVLFNDSDADGDVLGVAAGVFTTAHGGTISFSADGTFTYKAADTFYGTDFFDYNALDGFGGSTRGTMILNTSAPVGAIYGTAGIDNISGTAGDDFIYGMANSDVLYGLSGNDTLVGGDNKDTLSGGDGADVLVGGAGVDRLYGGAGNDQFVFDDANGTSADRVMDFRRGDLLVVNAADYGLDAGALPDASYFANAGAANVDHVRFLYNSADRSLSWDADGNAATVNVTIATFSKSVTLSDTDFLII
jgi:Ca2+-binding RTX toxin-like protein